MSTNESNELIRESIRLCAEICHILVDNKIGTATPHIIVCKRGRYPFGWQAGEQLHFGATQ